MNILTVNHRYYGWRESVKLVPQVKVATLDIGLLQTALRESRLIYDRDYPALLEELTEVLGLIQSARLLLSYIKGS